MRLFLTVLYTTIIATVIKANSSDVTKNVNSQMEDIGNINDPRDLNEEIALLTEYENEFDYDEFLEQMEVMKKTLDHTSKDSYKKSIYVKTFIRTFMKKMKKIIEALMESTEQGGRRRIATVEKPSGKRMVRGMNKRDRRSTKAQTRVSSFLSRKIVEEELAQKLTTLEEVLVDAVSGLDEVQVIERWLPDLSEAIMNMRSTFVGSSDPNLKINRSLMKKMDKGDEIPEKKGKKDSGDDDVEVFLDALYIKVSKIFWDVFDYVLDLIEDASP